LLKTNFLTLKGDSLMFTQSFQPATNKEGLARLTFLGYEAKEGTKEDGSPWSMFNINFLVKGKVAGTDRVIPVTTGFNYDPENLLGITLHNLGFEIPEAPTEEDEEGFEVVSQDFDDEGFEVAPEQQLDIMGFLNSIENNVYTARVYKATEGKRKGFWLIDASTIKLFKVAEKKIEDKTTTDNKTSSNGKGRGKKTTAKTEVSNTDAG
jgi:hypothetical protein